MNRHLARALMPACALICSFAAGAFAVGQAQEMITIPARILTPVSDSVYLKEDLEVRDYVHYFPGTDDPVTGIVESYYENGNKLARYSVVDGMVQGIWLEWYEDGPLRFYGEWQDSKAEGLILYFHPNGEISERAYARADLYNGPVEGWTVDGKKAFAGILKDNERLSYTEYPQE